MWQSRVPPSPWMPAIGITTVPDAEASVVGSRVTSPWISCAVWVCVPKLKVTTASALLPSDTEATRYGRGSAAAIAGTSTARRRHGRAMRETRAGSVGSLDRSVEGGGGCCIPRRTPDPAADAGITDDPPGQEGLAPLLLWGRR